VDICPGNVLLYQWCWPSYSTLPLPGRVLQTRLTKTGLNLSVKLCLYQDIDPTASQLVEDLDDKLFRTVVYNNQHVLYNLLPNRTDHSHILRPCWAWLLSQCEGWLQKLSN